MTCMECRHCAEAEANPASHNFTSGCVECSARALAHGPVYWAEALTPAYKTALQAIAGGEWQALHTRVKVWAGRLKA